MTAEEPEGRSAPEFRIETREAWLITALGIGAVALSLGAAPGWNGGAGAALALAMLAVAVIDRRRQIIPDPLNALAFAGGLIAAGLRPDVSPLSAALDALVRAIVMAALFFTFRAAYRKVRGVEGMGLGDVKLAGVAGAWLDWSLLPLVVEIAAVGALVVVLIGRLRGRAFDSRTRLPFGTFFAPAIWICWAVGAWRGDLAALPYQ